MFSFQTRIRRSHSQRRPRASRASRASRQSPLDNLYGGNRSLFSISNPFIDFFFSSRLIMAIGIAFLIASHYGLVSLGTIRSKQALGLPIPCWELQRAGLEIEAIRCTIKRDEEYKRAFALTHPWLETSKPFLNK